MQVSRIAASTVALLGVLHGCSTGSPDTSPVSPAAPALQGGAASVDELVDAFLLAIEQNDDPGLQRLLLSKNEYLEIIVPGHVPKGHPPQQTFEKNNEFFWSLLNTKNRMYRQQLLKDWGGKRYTDRRIAFSKPPEEHDWYTAYGQLRVNLNDADTGKALLLRSGWIAQVGDRYKFIGYEWDD